MVSTSHSYAHNTDEHQRTEKKVPELVIEYRPEYEPQLDRLLELNKQVKSKRQELSELK